MLVLEKTNKTLNWIMILAIVIRLGLFLAFPEPKIEKMLPLMSDAAEYNKAAISINNTGGYPTLLRPPVYPILIAAFYSAFGYKPVLVVLFQILISALTCLVIYRIAKLYFSQSTALLAGLFFAVDMTSILYSTILMTETIFVFLTYTGVYFLLKYSKKDKNNDFLILSTIFFSLAVLAKPVLQFFILIPAIYIFTLFRDNFWAGFRKAVLILLIFALPVIFWMHRNYLKSNCFAIRVDPLLVELMIAHPIEVDILRGQMPKNTSEDALIEAAYKKIRKFPIPYNDKTISKANMEVAREYLKKHPFIFIKVYFRGIVKYFTQIDYQNILNKFNIKDDKLSFDFSIFKKPVVLFKIVFQLIQLLYLLFCGIGVYYLLKNKKVAIAALFLAIILYFPVISGVEGCARYKLFSSPLIYILAAFGILKTIKKEGIN